MTKRLQSETRKNCKIRLEQLIQKHIGKSKNMYKRPCVKDGELVFLKILKKEIDSKRFRNRAETLNKLLVTNVNYYTDDKIAIGCLKNIWNGIQNGIRPMIAAYNLLGKKHPISVRLSEKIRYRFQSDIHYSQIQINYYHNPKKLVDAIYELLNTVGADLIEIDDMIALSILELAHQFKQTDLFKKALSKIVEFGLSSYGIAHLESTDKSKIFLTLVTDKPFECLHLDQFLKLIISCFESKAKAIEHLSSELGTCNWSTITAEKLHFLLENGFSIIPPINHQQQQHGESK
ncbi:predicted protein [Naegleria gruberi]|uniref:Predicted protein n=1 Tax=Naegleria gruberi TaxID=5762 RepID=D2VNC9_NAEGR|nr:uncharacterized protein NAEGRDRAFT_70451 [Naegleria gruberi]EFC41635.1 predicted protein [Naegleria gruberi]|eukprot:XP_002674379.1 predicted protein [Naegleria gruberi strain NEG-M]